MTSQTAEDLLSLYDRAPLNRRYWVSFTLLALITVLDFFDFFLIAFILAAIGPEWHLTYGQSALILYGGGVGAILGALVWGSLADVWGRKLQVVTGTFICAVSAGLIGFLPTGAWVLLALPRESVPLPTTRPASPPRASLTELYANPRLFWQTVIIWGGSSTAVYGYYLWGPTIVALVLGVPVGQAARYFVYVAGGAVIGKILVSLIAPIIGRRMLGVGLAFLAAICLVAAGFYHNAVVAGFPLMVMLIAASAFFCEGGFSNLAPYTVEQYGVRLGARSAGLGQAANGVGKILGPLALALIAGSSNLVSPQATENAVLPAFLFLSVNMLLVALGFGLLGVETHGRPMALGDEPATVAPTGPRTSPSASLKTTR